MPLLYPLFFVFTLFFYWSQKIAFICFTEKPPLMDQTIFPQLLKILAWTPYIHLLWSFIVFSQHNFVIFQNDQSWVKAQAIYLTELVLDHPIREYVLKNPGSYIITMFYLDKLSISQFAATLLVLSLMILETSCGLVTQVARVVNFCCFKDDNNLV